MNNHEHIDSTFKDNTRTYKFCHVGQEVRVYFKKGIVTNVREYNPHFNPFNECIYTVKYTHDWDYKTKNWVKIGSLKKGNNDIILNHTHMDVQDVHQDKIQCETCISVSYQSLDFSSNDFNFKIKLMPLVSLLLPILKKEK